VQWCPLKTPAITFPKETESFQGKVYHYKLRITRKNFMPSSVKEIGTQHQYKSVDKLSVIRTPGLAKRWRIKGGHEQQSGFIMA